MSNTADVAIVGLGAMGSAAAYHLSKRGTSVVGFDLATPPHTLGSTHGESRAIREAYFEDPLYVPLVQRSYDCWEELQEAVGEPLLLKTGALLLGPDRGALVAGTRLSADRHKLDYDILTAKQIRKHYAALDPDDDVIGLWEPRAGILLPEKCVAAHLAFAQEQGAALHFGEAVTEWRPDGEGVALKTAAGEYRASQLLLTPGPWIGLFLPDLDLPFTVERQVLYWFQPADDGDAFGVQRLPVFAWEYGPDLMFYGFPDLGEGVKVSLHHQGRLTDVDSIDQNVGKEEESAMRVILTATMPKLPGALLRTQVCMYTNTPDEHFLIDFHPKLPQVLIASACSGHGFKFSSAIGEVLADMLRKGGSRFDLTPFRIDRFLKKGQ